ncbi:MAG: pyridoxal-phosphate dependent enzyme [Bacteroidetes bacterium]|nr:pyridoxal-phosphate dependent enzyme [Bacteroidota bacterium]
MFQAIFNTNNKVKITLINVTGVDGAILPVHVARFDQLHPIVSGNKFYKLKYNVAAALDQGKRGILTMGGAYSNHLAATAFFCKENNLKSTGIIRGEIKLPLNPTLQFCTECGMELIPIERNEFDASHPTMQKIIKTRTTEHFVPMGGANAEGIKGAAEMIQSIENIEQYQIIVCAVGSGTMFKGLKESLLPHQSLLGIPAIQIRNEDQDIFTGQLFDPIKHPNIQINFNYSFGGYAKKNETLLHFMKKINQQYQLPLDFIYTAKALYGLLDLIEKGILQSDQPILFIHSGGLQGNNSIQF